MQYQDFSNTLTHSIRNSGETYAPFTGYPFQALPSPVIQVIAGRDFDLCVGTRVTDTAGRAYFVVNSQSLPGALYLVSLIAQEVANV